MHCIDLSRINAVHFSLYRLTVNRKLLELAGKAGAIYRIDGTVLINRDIFENYLEQFHEKSTLLGKDQK